MTTPVSEKLPQAHLAWLKEFSVVMQRRYAYPAGHPSRVAAEGVAFTAISKALESHPQIAIGITQRQLIINGAGTDPKNPAIGELSERLHRQGVGSVTLRVGLTAQEFDALLERIATASPATVEDDERALKDPGVHVTVEMLSYEGLTLADDSDESNPTDGTGDRLWRELAEFALVGWDGFDESGGAGGGNAEPRPGDARPSGSIPEVPEGDAPAPEPRRTLTPRQTAALRRISELPSAFSPENLAKMINEHAENSDYASNVFKSLLRVGRHARRRGRSGSGAVAQRLRETLDGLAPGTLRSFLDAELDPARKQALLLQGVDALPVSAVLDWIEAAAQSSGEGISQHLLRLLKKLSSQTHRRRDGGADDGGEAMRDAARQLVTDWTLEVPDSPPHTGLLEKLSSYDGGAKTTETGGGAGADRIVQIALETNVSGPDVIAAIDKLIDEKRLGLLFKFLEDVERATIASPSVMEHLLEPATVRRVLLTEPVEVDGAQHLLQQCEAWHADAILDALAISESESTRRLVIGRLRELGDSVRDEMIARMDGAPWYMQRNLLMLLGELPDPPVSLPLEAFAKHEEPMLRLEAIRVLARIPDRREVALHEALNDPDARVLRGAIELAIDGLPKRSQARALQIVTKSERGSELRLRSIPVLAQVPLPAARDWLLGVVMRRKGFLMFRRWALVEKSPEMLAAIRVLASTWPSDRSAAPALKLAAMSGDRAIEAAAAGRSEG